MREHKFNTAILNKLLTSGIGSSGKYRVGGGGGGGGGKLL